jgi:hypothetical protein
MLKISFYATLISLGVWVGGQSALAQNYPPSLTDQEVEPSSPVPQAPSQEMTFPGTPPPGAPMGTPPTMTSSNQSVPAGPGETPKFYTITAELRETYDDNVYTSSNDKVSSFETDVTPSILFNIPMENSQFAARLTVGGTYYENEPASNFEFTSSLLARFTHQFSDRFAIDVRDEAGYFTEPGLFSDVGTLYRNGSYVSNTFSTDFTAQWTPLVSSVTSLSNTVVYYDDSNIATGQDNMQNSFSQSIGFAILPKYTLVFAALYSGVSYNDVARGYDSYTGMTGIDWTALPTLSISTRIGASYTVDQGNEFPSPYGSLSIAWQLGRRSNLQFGYSYSVVPTDVTTASGQVASRIYTNFAYDISRSWSSHLNLAVTDGDYTNDLVQANTTGTFTEWDTALEAGLTYHISDHFDTNMGYIFSDVSSELSFRDYTRNQFYLGITGSY